MTRLTPLAISPSLLFAAPPETAAAQQAPGLGPRPSSSPVPNDLRATNRTDYTDKTELFITFRPPFIVGQSVRIGAHLPKLGERFLPYADATVTATLTVVDAVVDLVALDSAKPARRVLAIPRSAVVEIDGIPHVYVQRHPEAFDLAAIKPGTGNETYVQVLEGLRKGQRIVIRGGAKMPRK